MLDLPARRRELAALFSWAIPAAGALAVLARHAPLVECGAGTGYWAALLRARGVDVLASDLAPPGPRGRAGNRYHGGTRRPWTAVEAASAVDAVRAARGRTLFLCWPPYDDDGASYAALRAYRGDVFVYAGGGPGGPTGTVRFHRELELNWHPAEQVALPNWPGLRDRLVVYRRNPVRLPLSQARPVRELPPIPADRVGRPLRRVLRPEPARDGAPRQRPPGRVPAGGRRRDAGRAAPGLRAKPVVDPAAAVRPATPCPRETPCARVLGPLQVSRSDEPGGSPGPGCGRCSRRCCGGRTPAGR